MSTLSGDESPISSSGHRNGEHVGGLVNGSIDNTGGQLTSELRNLVSILGRQSDSGISLEQLLTGNSPIRSTTPTQALSHPFPTTPSSSKSTSWMGRKRGRPFEGEESAKRRRSGSSYTAKQSGDKCHNKGLRHFSQRVCEKVRQKGNTTYNEVADELVRELSESERKSNDNMPIDHKNIRRRVYDALNVLMAMNIISKEKKDIRWIGLPTNSIQECQHIEEELAQAEQRIQSKRNKVEELIVQILSYKNLMKRNRERVSSLGAPAQNSAIGLPFIIVNTNKSTTIDCSISSDKSEYVFSFDNAFELHNDIDVLKKMGLDCGIHSGSCSAENLKQAKSILPKAFGDILDEIAQSKNLPTSDSFPQTPTAPLPSSISSTPTITPTVTPFTTPTASPAAIAAVLAKVSSLQQSPHSSSPMAHSGPSPAQATPVLLPHNSTPPTNLASEAGTPLMATSTRGKTIIPVSTKTSRSPVSTAKAVLHHRCPSNHPGTASPLAKSYASLESSIGGAVQSSPLHGSPSSSLAARSPSTKFVTVSKVNNEHLNSLLQQLQQNPSISKLLPATANHSNGNDTSSFS